MFKTWSVNIIAVIPYYVMSKHPTANTIMIAPFLRRRFSNVGLKHESSFIPILCALNPGEITNYSKFSRWLNLNTKLYFVEEMASVWY